MAKIASYEIDVDIVSRDKWIGSDSQNNWRTKNFTAGDVANFINVKSLENQILRYTYVNSYEGSRPSGTLSFDPNNSDYVAFSGITSFMLSKYDLYSLNKDVPTDISAFYSDPLVGSDVLITQADDITQWAIYRWTASTQDATETDFYDITVTYEAGSGGLTKDKDYLVSLLQYDAANAVGDKTFVYTQNVASDEWVVDHNLDKFPSVTVVDSGSSVVNGEIEYNDINQVTIRFRSPFTGKAFFN